jgi:hypothetical protein
MVLAPCFWASSTAWWQAHVVEFICLMTARKQRERKEPKSTIASHPLLPKMSTTFQNSSQLGTKHSVHEPVGDISHSNHMSSAPYPLHMRAPSVSSTS